MFSSLINVLFDLYPALQTLFDSTWVHRNTGSKETPGSLLSVHSGLSPVQRGTNYKRSDEKSRLKGDKSAENGAAGCVFCQLSVWPVVLHFIHVWWSHYIGWSFMLEHRLPFNTSTVCPQWIHPTHYLVYLLGVSNFFERPVIVLFWYLWWKEDYITWGYFFEHH